MKKLLFLSMIICSQNIFAQITTEKNKLVKDGQTYKMSQYKQVFKNTEALSYFKKAKTNNMVGGMFAGIGGGVMGYGLARALSGNKATVTTNSGLQTVKQDKSGAWTAVGIGAGIVGIGIPFAVAAAKNAKKAIEIENGNSTSSFQPYFKLESADKGLALSYNF